MQFVTPIMVTTVSFMPYFSVYEAYIISVGVFQSHSFLHVKLLTSTTLLPSHYLISRAFFLAHGLWLGVSVKIHEDNIFTPFICVVAST